MLALAYIQTQIDVDGLVLIHDCVSLLRTVSACLRHQRASIHVTKSLPHPVRIRRPYP